jgi:hypothetical protein
MYRKKGMDKDAAEAMEAARSLELKMGRSK